MNDWQTCTIGDLGRVVTGTTPPAKSPEWFGNATAFITPSDIANVARRARPHRRLSLEGTAALRTRLVPEGSVCVVCIGATIGKVCLTEADSITNQQINAVVPRSGIDGRFVYYLLRHQAPIFASTAGGAATPLLNKSAFTATPVRIPDLPTQIRIGLLLGCLDDLIEKNLRRIELLEQMAQTIYREWFVRFRYPGHAGTALVSSSVGPIPAGWVVGTLGSLAREVRESVSPSNVTAALPYVPIDAIPPNSITLRSSRPGIEAASSLRLFEERDVLFGAMRAYFHKVCLAPFAGVTRSTCFVLRPKVDHFFVVMTFAQDETVAYAAARSSGSTIPYAKWEGVLSKMTALVPPAPLTDSFGEVVGSLITEAQRLASQSQTLESLRGFLLPKLVTGQVDVSGLDLDALVVSVA